MKTTKVKHTKESKIICDYIQDEIKSIGMVCHNCSSLFTRENAKFPVYKEGKKTNYYICSECKFRS